MSSIDPACEKRKVENEMSSALEAGAATPAPADVDSCSRAAVALLQLHPHTAQKDLVKTLLDAAQTMTTQGQSLDGLGMDSASEGRPMRSSKRSCTQMQPFSFDDPPALGQGRRSRDALSRLGECVIAGGYVLFQEQERRNARLLIFASSRRLQRAF